MIKEIDIAVTPEIAFNDELLHDHLSKLFQVSRDQLFVQKLRRSIDARSKLIKINYSLRVFIDEPHTTPPTWEFKYNNVSSADPVIIVGAGPAGMFAALKAIELGLKPIVLERGKDVQSRRRDLANINKHHMVHPDSNYCFGEGGAGTYSDGKLYTRSKKRGDVRRILEILHLHGAPEEILIDAHPHIGTNKLPKVVSALRDTIKTAGGEIYFETRVTDLIIEGNELRGVVSKEGSIYKGLFVVLATGHSARDIYYLLHKKQVVITPKPFAMGVRIEHPQSLIDNIQYHCTSRSAYLPASSYALVQQIKYDGKERGVFSFCMCPGGFIVPSATAEEEVVVNGMSPSKRDSEFANSGIVVAIELEDLKPFAAYGALAGLEYQKSIERNAWVAGGKSQTAPAQRMVDFIHKKQSQILGKTSYQPGLNAVDLNEVMPESIAYRLRHGFAAFGQKMKGYLTNEAQLVGVESRTSSPLFIPRDKETLEHLTLKRMFPCGEGAGYAGGIVSAAMDGEICMEKAANLYYPKSV